MSSKTVFWMSACLIVAASGAWFFTSRHSSAVAVDGDDARSGYVDSATCYGCHQDIAKTYRLTGMGRSFYRPTAANTVEDYKVHNTLYNRASDRYYTMIERDGKWYQRRHQLGYGGKETNAVEKQVEYVVGSGNHSRTYLYRDAEGHLMEMPVSWYSEKGGYWAMSPGFDRANQEDFRRVILNECFDCHNSYPQSVKSSTPVNSSHFRDPVFGDRVPEGIDCQRCHGPGRAHVDAAGSGKATPEAIRSTIVNPAKLDRERQLETCMQCHLETTSRMASIIPRYDKAPFSYRPGEPLADYFVYVDQAPGTGHDDKFEIAHAAYRLRMSACFRSSQMTCTTCHNPHDIPRGEAATQHYDGVCKSCHAATHAAEMPAKANCIGCHMPKRRSDDAVHVVMTDHYIQRNKPSRDLLATLQEGDLVSLDLYRGEVIPYNFAPGSASGGISAKDRLYDDVAQANDSTDPSGIPQLQQDLEKDSSARPEFYYELAEAAEKTGKHDDAIRWYDETLRRAPDFHPAADGLAVALIASGNLIRAQTWLEKTVAAAPTDIVALADLGNVYIKQGKYDQAQATLTQALRVNPDNPDAQNLLGLAQAQKQDWTAAERSFRAAIAIQPDSAPAHENLANMLARGGDYAQARYHFEKSIAAKPDNPGARATYGLLLAMIKSYDQAVLQLREAVRLNPGLMQAHHDLADVLLEQGHLDAAAVEYRRVIELDPNSYGAQLSLGQILARSGNVTEARGHIEKAAQSPDPEIRDAALKALR